LVDGSFLRPFGVRPGVCVHHVLGHFNDLRALGQIGTTIGLGLLFDTLIVRSSMTPSIAASSVAGSGGRYTCAVAVLAGCCARTEPAAPCDNCLGQAVALTLVTAR
jgi:hypothetical protein